jgi:hypothetical protein
MKDKIKLSRVNILTLIIEDYKNMKKKLKQFTQKLGTGLKQELSETRQIPGQIRKGNLKEAGKQIGDIGRMIVIAAVWVLPAGAIISGFIVKYSKKIRPSAFLYETDESV